MYHCFTSAGTHSIEPVEQLLILNEPNLLCSVQDPGVISAKYGMHTQHLVLVWVRTLLMLESALLHIHNDQVSL